MTPKDFRKILEARGLSQMQAARIIGANPRLVRSWASLRRAHPLPLGAEARIRTALEAYENGISSKDSTTL